MGCTVWSAFPHTTKYFDPSTSPVMINYRAANLRELLEELRKEGVQIAGGIEESEYSKFAWVIDPDGNRIELLEPPENS